MRYTLYILLGVIINLVLGGVFCLSDLIEKQKIFQISKEDFMKKFNAQDWNGKGGINTAVRTAFMFVSLFRRTYVTHGHQQKTFRSN